jgi:hypothetical protein
MLCFVDVLIVVLFRVALVVGVHVVVAVVVLVFVDVGVGVMVRRAAMTGFDLAQGSSQMAY